MKLNWVDYISILVLLFSVLFGHIKKLFNAACYFSSFLISAKLYLFASQFVFFINEIFFRMLIGFLVVFVCIMLALSTLYHHFPYFPILQPVNRFLGMVYGLLRGLSILVFMSFIEISALQTALNTSFLMPYLKPIRRIIIYIINYCFPKFMQDFSPILSSYFNIH